MATPGSNPTTLQLPTTPPKRRRWWIVVVAVLIVLALVASTWWLLSSSSETSDKAVATKLTVTTVSYTCPTDAKGLVPYEIGALKGVGDSPAERAWSDSVSTRMTTTSLGEKLSEVQLVICNDPLYGAMVANYFANLDVDGTKVLSLNPWLKGFEGSGETVIHTQAANFVPLNTQQLGKYAEMNQAWQAVASKLNTLLYRFALVGVGTETSVFNYHLLGGGLVAGGLPLIGLNADQEKLPALHLVLTKKGREGCLLEIGFNTGDKRLEGFNCSSSTQPPAKPNCKTNCGTPPQVCKVNCTPTTPPGCKVNCTLDNKDPNVNPTSKDGGGRNIDSGPGTTPSHNPAPSAPRTNPAPPAPTGPPPGAEPTHNVPPAPATSVPAPATSKPGSF